MNTESTEMLIKLMVPNATDEFLFFVGKSIVVGNRDCTITNISMQAHEAGYIRFVVYYRPARNGVGEEISQVVEWSGPWMIQHHPRKVDSGERV